MPETLDDTNLGTYTLLPADDPIQSAEEELDGAFLDPEDPNLPASFLEPKPIPQGRTWQFDLQTGRFVAYGDRPAELHGLESLRQWIDFTLITAAGAHSIYPEDYGMDDPTSMIGEMYTPALEADWQRQVEKALSPHDRIESVSEFRFEHGEAEEITNWECTVRTVDGRELLVQAPFEGD